MAPPIKPPTAASSKVYLGGVGVSATLPHDGELVARGSASRGSGGGAVNQGVGAPEAAVPPGGEVRGRSQHSYHQPLTKADPKSGSSRGLNSSTSSSGGAQGPYSPKAARMGNGASNHAHFTIDGESMDVHKVKVLVPELRNEIKRRDKIIEQYDCQLREKEEQLKEKDVEIGRLREEAHKLKSVLQLKVDTLRLPEVKPDLLSTIDENQAEPVVNKGPAKKQGVSGESSSSRTLGYVDLTHHEKDFK